jgi:hypothetical protein
MGLLTPHREGGITPGYACVRRTRRTPFGASVAKRRCSKLVPSSALPASLRTQVCHPWQTRSAHAPNPRRFLSNRLIGVSRVRAADITERSGLLTLFRSASCFAENPGRLPCRPSGAMRRTPGVRPFGAPASRGPKLLQAILSNQPYIHRGFESPAHGQMTHKKGPWKGPFFMGNWRRERDYAGLSLPGALRASAARRRCSKIAPGDFCRTG